MSQISIEVVAVDREERPNKNGKGTYEMLTVTYKQNYMGKVTVNAKKLISFAADKDVYAALRNAVKEDTFTIEQEKEGDYWVWKTIARQDTPLATSVATPGGTKVPVKSTYETPEERAQKQIYIVRQSSLASAINLLALTKEPATKEKVLGLAKDFENYVFGEPFNIADTPDDIPL